ncbi:predicted protein [Nematostella vectensis]|uniref:Uncharacterized protein n=1 Tax=Nematostella vectensis TaxID=45351 RepID=A7SLT4_NEMVE|nr:predicted protein [Nematostella vectensis]|eukprot:XP_001627395.1 predicted protein [Nematostella vectensis]
MTDIENMASFEENPLKRRAINCDRLQNKVSWIRQRFVKDENSGVRKTDFYNFVLINLGKMSYRDVWHLLKMAYPHVERVRRGRMYMYWGIQFAGAQTENTLSGRSSDEDYNFYESQENGYKRRCLDNTAVVKKERESQFINESCPEEGDVLKPEEIKVYTSFEDYKKAETAKMSKNPQDEPNIEHSTGVSECSKNVVTSCDQGGKKILQGSGNELDNNNTTRDATRSPSPPLEIFAPSSFFIKKPSDKSSYHDFSSSSSCEESCEDLFLEEEELEKETKDNDGKDLGIRNDVTDEHHPPCDSVDKKGKVADFSMSLLKPDNINKVCIPLLSSKAETESSCNSTSSCTSSRASSTDAVANIASQMDKHLDSVRCDPIIVSVSSIAHQEDENKPEISASLITEGEEWVEIKDICTQTDKPQSTLCSIHGKTITTPSQYTRQASLPIMVGQPATMASIDPETQSAGGQSEGTLVTSQAMGYLRSRSSPSTYDFSDSVKMIMISSSYNPANAATQPVLTRGTTSASPDGDSTGRVTWAMNGQRPLMPKVMTDSRTLVTGSKTSPDVFGIKLPTGDLKEANETLDQIVQQRFKVSGNATRFTRSPETARTPPGVPINEGMQPSLPASSKPDRTPPVSICPTGILARAVLANKTTGRNITGISRNALLESLRSSSSDGDSLEGVPVDLMYNESDKGLLAEARLNNVLASSNLMDRTSNKRPLDSSPDLSDKSEAIRKLLSEQEIQRNSPLFSSLSDLRARVHCLSSELEKERTSRLGLEVELRKTKALLIQERRMNDNLAFMLLKNSN